MGYQYFGIFGAEPFEIDIDGITQWAQKTEQVAFSEPGIPCGVSGVDQNACPGAGRPDNEEGPCGLEVSVAQKWFQCPVFELIVILCGYALRGCDGKVTEPDES